ncbi:copper resistance CopC/CopD family protein [Dactylosporangium matsuzakiense]|uniref:Transport integral membrane protein n=1 Tax=Dactylosporangium matsuzakiense TaxID=53360 RepID=A0A9W6KEQ5_9ACTN|nr:copper resistance protein CopC/CopD [Dactylosporangium matsuzakiense]UWZ44019.1 copper resistance protein CopC/CopD [Dactylosporangium matsuzakiense]GLL00707.1 transport integral membrane protein [Dactylosporangium matsuzakiense]
MNHRRWSVPLAMLLGALAILVLPAGPASAHAELEKTAPVAGTVLDQLPGEVTLSFSEQVRLVTDKIKVTAPDGSRADTGKPAVRDQELVIPLKSGGPKGTYLVSYRVISADSHPVAGGYSFSYGQPSATPNANANGNADTTTDQVVKNTMSAARFLGFAGLVLLVGPTLILFALWPRRLSTRDPGRLALVGAGVLAVSTILELYLQIPYTAGTSLFDASGAAASEVLGTPFGAAHLVRLGVVLATVILLRPVISGRASKVDQTLLVILGIVGLATWPISGHPSASPVPTLTVVADAAHLASMSIWLGGLVMLFGFLLRRANTRELAAIVPVWSGWALFAITVLVLAGTAQALVEIGTLDALTGTLYGQIVMIKVALLAVVVGVAAYSRSITNRRFAPPPVVAATEDDEADEDEDDEPAEPAAIEDRDRRRLRTAVIAEVGIAVVVLLMTSVLVQTSPARAGQGDAPPGPFDTVVSTSLLKLQVDISPATVGQNSIHVYAVKPDGSGPQTVVEWKATAALASKGIEPLTVPMLGISDDHAIGQISLVSAGTWEFKFTARVDDLNQTTVTVQVPVK